MYEFLVLGRLVRQPMHGYLIGKLICSITSPVKQLQWGSLYPVLARLEAEGLIRAEENIADEDGRSRKVYAITSTGRARLHELMLDTEHHAGDYAPVFAHKVALFSEIASEERLYLSRHYAVYAQQHIDHLERKVRELPDGLPRLSAAEFADVVEVLEHRIAFWRTERQWAEQLIARQSVKENA